MKRSVLPSLLLVFALDASADLTVDGVNYSLGDDGQASGPREQYTMYVKDGRMRMDSGDQMTMLLRPANGDAYEMVLLDHAERQAIVLSRSEIVAAENAVSATAEPGSVRVLGSGEPILGYGVTEIEFSFQGDASLPDMAGGQEMPPEMADMMKVSMTVSGTALVSEDIEGLDEITALYRRMSIATELLGGGETSSLTRGLSDMMTAVSEHGFPLKTTTTSDVKIEVDASGPMASMLRSMTGQMPDMKSTTVSEVTDISTDAVDAGLFFDGLPEGYTETAMPSLTP